jgi:hypothetical protein
MKQLTVKATELRIGNKVQPKPEDRQRYGTMCEVTQVYKDGFTVDYHYPGAWFQPIPLSPDILEKITPKFENFGYTVKVTVAGRLDIRINGSYITTISYLHEYQNLIFALTGEELNINL